MPDTPSILPAAPSVDVADIDLSRYLPANTSLQGATAIGNKPKALPQTLPGGAIDVSKYQPSNEVVADSDLQKVSGYNSFKTNPKYNTAEAPIDNIRDYAAKQGTGEWLANNLLKFGSVTANAFSGTFNQNIRNAQFLSTLLPGQKTNYDKLYDNTDNTASQQAIDNKYPTYGTGELDNSWKRFLPWNAGKSDFGGQLIPQLGFTVGTIGETLAENALITATTGGLAEPVEAAKTAITAGGRLLTGLQKLFETSNGITNFRKGLQVLDTIKNEGSFLSTVGAGAVKGGKLLANTYAMYNTAAGEAAFEANSIYTQHVQDLSDDFEKKNGYKPFGQDLDKIKQSASSTATATFGWNLPILLGSNLVQFGNVLQPFKGEVAKTAEDLALELSGKGLSTTIQQVADKAVEGKLGKIFGVASKLGHFLKEGASEGWEEVAQSIASKGSSAYYKNIYEGSKNGTPLNDALNSTFDYAGSTGSFDDFVGGFLGGMLFKSVGLVAEKSGLRDSKVGQKYFGPSEKVIEQRKKELKTQTAQVLSQVSTEDIQKYLFSPEVRNFIQQGKSQQEIKEAIKRGDILGYDDAKSQSVRHALFAGIETGKLNMVLSLFDVHKELDNEDIAKLSGLTDEKDISNAKSDVSNLVSAIKERAYGLQSDWGALSQKYVNPHEIGTPNYTAFEGAKRERLFAKDQIEQDRKYVARERSQVSNETEGRVSSNLIDHAVDTDLLKQQVGFLQTVVDNAIDTSDPQYQKQKEQLSMLKDVQGELSKDKPNLTKVASSLFKIGNQNHNTTDFSSSSQDTVKRLENILRVEERNKANVAFYNLLNKKPISQSFLEHLQAQQATVEPLKQTPAPQPAPAPVQTQPTGNARMDTDNLKALTGNPNVFIEQRKGEYVARVKTKGNNGTQTTSDIGVYNTPEELFADIENIKTKAPAISVPTTDHSAILEASDREIEEQKALQRGDVFESSKKAANVLYTSSTEPTWTDRSPETEHLYSDQVMFHNLSNGTFSQDVVAIPVTAGNVSQVEISLSLSPGTLSFIREQAGDTYSLSSSNPNGHITFIYAAKTTEGHQLINNAGEPITDNHSNQVVQGRLVTGDQEALERDDKFRNYFTPEQKKQIVELNQKIRTHFINDTSFQTFPFSFSKGIENVDETQDTTTATSVTNSRLIAPQDIKGDSVYIGTNIPKVLHNQTSETTIPGRPYLVLRTKDSSAGEPSLRYIYLNNQKLSAEQKDSVLKALSTLKKKAEEAKMNTKDIYTTPEYIFLSGILQLTTKDIYSPRQGRVYMNKGQLSMTFGDNSQFTSDFSSPLLDSWLDERYHNVNNSLLNNNKFRAPGKEYASYAHYLLTADTTPLFTRAYDTTEQETSDELPFVQRYAIYDTSFITGEVGDIEQAKKTLNEEKPPAKKKGFKANFAAMVSNDEAPQQEVPQPAPASLATALNKSLSRRRKVKEEQQVENFSSSAETAVKPKVKKTKPVAENNPSPKKVTSLSIEQQLINAGADQDDFRTMSPAEKEALLSSVTKKEQTKPTPLQQPKEAPEKQSPTQEEIRKRYEKEYSSFLKAYDNSIRQLTEEKQPQEHIDEAKRDREGVLQGLMRDNPVPPSDEERLEAFRKEVFGDDLDATPFRIERVFGITNNPVTQDELSWLKDKLPQVGLSYNPQMERVFGNYRVWGSYKNNIINIYAGAEKGTVYHEAFEAVYSSILTKKQKQALLDEFRKRSGTFTTWEGREVPFSEASDLDAKEAIADEFIDWKAKKDISEKAPKSFFQKLWNYIKAFVQRMFSPINRVYSNIEKGSYAATPLRDTMGEYFKVTGLSEAENFAYMNGFSNLLFSRMNTKAVNILNGLDEGKYSESEIYTYLKEETNRLFNYSTDEEKKATSLTLKQRSSFILATTPSITAEEAAKQARAEFEEAKERYNTILVPHWDEVVTSHKNFFRAMDIGFTEARNIEGAEDANRDQDSKNREYNPDPLVNDVKDSISDSVKLVLATLTDNIFFRSKVDGLIKRTDVISDITMMGNVVTNYQKVFNTLLNHLSGYNNEAVIRQKLLSLSTISEQESKYLDGSPIAHVKAQLAQVYDKMFSKEMSQIDNEGDMKFRMRCNAAFFKQQPTFYRIRIDDETGNAYLQNELYDRISKLTANKAMQNLRDYTFNRANDADWWLKKKGKEFYVNPDTSLFSQYADSDPQKKQVLQTGLQALGFKVFDQELLDNLNSDELNDLGDEYNGIVYSIGKHIQGKHTFENLTWASLDIQSRINNIANLYSNKTYDENEPMHFTSSGDKQSNFLDGNYISSILSDINSLSRDEFIQKHPYYDDYFSRGSTLLDKLFQKKANGEKLRTAILSSIESKGEGKAMAAAEEHELFISRLNASLTTRNREGMYATLENADGITDWGLQVGRYISPNDVDTEAFTSILTSHLMSEVSFALSFKTGENPERNENVQLNTIPEHGIASGEKRKLGESLQFYASILPKELVIAIHKAIDGTTLQKGDTISRKASEIVSSINMEDVKDAFLTFARAQAKEDRNYLAYNRYLEQTGEDSYDLYCVDQQYFADNSSKGLSSYGIDQMLLDHQLNYIIHNIELFRVFFGSPLYYKDGMKRFKSFQSPRIATANTDSINNKLTELLNYQLVNSKRTDIKSTDATFHTFRKDLSFYSVGDIKTYNALLANIYKNFGANESTDAQMHMLLSHVKELLWKSGANWSTDQEKELQLNNAYMRLQLSEKKTPNTNNTYYTYTSEGMKGRDLEILEPYLKDGVYDLPALGYISILKPVQTGFKASDVQEPSLIKTSVAPLTWKMVEGTKMETVFLDMFTNQVGGFMFNSAHKVGQSGIDGKVGSIIAHDGSVNSPSSIAVAESVPWETMGIQVETQGTKDKSTIGTQILKLITADIYSAGVPRDFSEEKDSVKALYAWNNLSPQEKKAQSRLYTLDQEHYEALSDVFTNNYQDFLKKFGIEETAEGFRYDNKEALHGEISKYIEKHGVPTHVLEQFQLSPDKKQFIVPLEMMQDYKTIKHILYSMVDKNVLSPKLHGGQKIQMSSALFDKLDHSYNILFRNKANKGEWNSLREGEDYNPDVDEYVVTNTSLKFYEKTPDGVSRMQVKMSSRMKNELNKYRQRRGLPLLRDEELLSWLKANQPKLLEGVGFRIPTQALSSMDAFEVVGFLPEYMGDAIAVPAELPTKAGSDFDVDKLNTYLNNYVINRKTGYPEFVGFHTSIEETRLYYKDRFDEETDDFLSREGKNREFNKELLEALNTMDYGFDESLTTERFIDDNQGLLNRMIEQEGSVEGAAISLFNRLENIGGKVNNLSNATLRKEMQDNYVNTMTKKAIENRYFNAMASLLLTPENYEKLISPNSSSEFESGNPDSITNNLSALKTGETSSKKPYSLAPFLSFINMVKSRSLFMKSKNNTGISAIGSTSHANAQRFLSYIDFTKKLAKEGLIWKGNPSIKFEHNNITIDGKEYPSLSNITGKGQLSNILEYLSKFTNGSVDALKDDWLSKYGMVGDAAPVVVLATKLGIDPYQTGLLINHPLVKEYMRIKALKKSPVYAFNKRVQEQYSDLRTDDNYIEYFGNVLNLRAYKHNFASFEEKELKAIEDHIRLGGENSDISLLAKRNDQYNKELAITVFRQFLQLKELSQDLRTVIDASNHETTHLNSNAIVPAKESNYEYTLKTSPFMAMYSKDGSVKRTTASEAIRDTTFVGTIINNLKGVHNLLHEEVFMDKTKQLLDYTIGYLSKDQDKQLFIQNVQDAVEQFESNQINAAIHSADVPAQLSTGYGRVADNINRVFKKGSEAYKNILLEKDIAQNKTNKEKNADGTSILDYIDVSDVSDHSPYWWMKLKGKPTNSGPYSSNVFYQALRTLEQHKPELFSNIMLASVLQSGINFNRNSITNFLSPEIFNQLSQGVRDYTLNETFFILLRDLYVQNTYRDKDNPLITEVEGFPSSPINFTLRSKQMFLNNTLSTAVKPDNPEDQSFHEALSSTLTLIPSHRYKSIPTGKDKNGKTTWSQEKYHKPNWGAGKDYIMSKRWSRSKGEMEYIVMKKMPVEINTLTSNLKQYDPTTFYVYQKLPLRGTRFHEEYHVPNEANPQSWNSRYTDNASIAQASPQEIYDKLTEMYKNNLIQTSPQNQIRKAKQEIYIKADSIKLIPDENYKLLAPSTSVQASIQENILPSEENNDITTPEGLPNIREENQVNGSCS